MLRRFQRSVRSQVSFCDRQPSINATLYYSIEHESLKCPVSQCLAESPGPSESQDILQPSGDEDSFDSEKTMRDPTLRQLEVSPPFFKVLSLI